MVRRLFLILVASICLLGVMSNSKPQGHASSATTWEYKIFTIPPPSTQDQTEQKLSQLGSQGWELVHLIPGEGAAGGVFYLKRAK